MAKSCDFKTSEASTKAWFRTNQAVDKFLNIPEGRLNQFRTYNTHFSNEAFKRFGHVGIKPTDRLLYEENGGKRALPNTTIFHMIDAGKNVFYPENMYLKDAVRQTPVSATDQFLRNLNELNLTPEVITYLYNENGSTSKLEDYAFILRDLVNNLKSQGFTNQQILEDIKCL